MCSIVSLSHSNQKNSEAHHSQCIPKNTPVAEMPTSAERRNQPSGK